MLRALIVEDNHVYRREFKESLCRNFPSMVVEEAESSEEALEKIKLTAPDLVFIDIRLPGMNGLQLTQRVKKDLPNIRIAIVTGYDVPEYRQAAAQFGAEAFFVKESLKWDEVKAFVDSVEEVVS